MALFKAICELNVMYDTNIICISLTIINHIHLLTTTFWINPLYETGII